MLATLDPIALDIPDRISSMIPPRPPQSGVSRELFPRHTGYVFDPIAAAATAAEVTLAQLLDAKRAARLNNQYARDNKLPSFSNVLAILIDDGWPRRSEDRFAVIERQTQVADSRQAYSPYGDVCGRHTGESRCYGCAGKNR